MKEHMITFGRLSNGQRDGYATGFQLDYAYFKEHYRLIAADLNKKKVPDADPKPIQKNYFYWKPIENATIYFIFEEVKQTSLNLSKWTVKGLWIYVYFNIIST